MNNDGLIWFFKSLYFFGYFLTIYFNIYYDKFRWLIRRIRIRKLKETSLIKSNQIIISLIGKLVRKLTRKLTRPNSALIRNLL